MKLRAGLRLSPADWTELALLGLGMAASYAVQELAALGVAGVQRQKELDEEVTRLRAVNDQLAAHNERLEFEEGLRDQRIGDLCGRVSELTEANGRLRSQLERREAGRSLVGPVDRRVDDELLPPHHD